MNTIRNLLSFATIVTTAPLASAAVPSGINYQGRLTNAAGIPQAGNRTMNLKIYDAPTAGTQLYAESIGSIPVDANGIYGFQFGASGTSNTLVTETIAVTDGTALTYQKTLSNTPVISGTASVTDGTYNWNEITGNPGSPATATATTISGFVIGATVTSGGSGYTSAPSVTITGSGSGATATATVSSGAVSGITINSTGSGYTVGTIITIAPPPAPFIIDASGGTLTATYASAPAAGQTITATYRYTASGISGALAAGAEQWLELAVDGIIQTPRQKVLAVPFAMTSQYTENAAGTLANQINDLSKDIALFAGGIPSNSLFGQNFSVSKSSIISGESTLMDKGTHYAPIYEQNSTVSYTGGSTSLSQDIENMSIRGVYYHCGPNRQSGGNITYYYSDNTSSIINVNIIQNNQYQENPNPQKIVKRINLVFTETYSYGLWMTFRANKSGDLAIAIPESLSQKSRIGFFINKSLASLGDQMSSLLVGTSGSQVLTVDSYNIIKSNVGVPKKIIIHFNADNGNLEKYSSISSFVIRYSE